MQVPEGKSTVTAEARDLAKAVAAAAEELSVHPSQVDHKLDLSHFRSALGTSVSRDTVKIIAWASDRDISEAPPKRAPRPRRDEGDNNVDERPPRRSRDDDRSERKRDDRKSRSRRDDDRPSRGRGRDRDRDRDDERRERRGPADGETDASKFAAEWFATTLKHMDVDSTVVATGDDERVHVAITAERAGRIVGKRGATLRSIRHLLGLAIAEQFGERVIDVDVGDDRPREDREDREERSSNRRSRDRDDRGRGRGRDRDRDNGRGRSRSRGRGRPGGLSEEELTTVATKAAKRALADGSTVTIKYAANSYDRRVMHLAISEIDGVESQSKEVEVDGETVKYVQVIPAGD